MPRQITKAKGATRKRSLGGLALWWIESFVVHGPGPVMYQPVRHGLEYSGFIMDCYSLAEDGERCHDSAFLSRPKGCDKSGIAARLALFEALGPCRFSHWATADEPPYEYLGHKYYFREGEAVGKRILGPKVKIMATVKDQANLIYDTVYANFEDGPLSVLKGEGLKVQKSGIFLPPPFGGSIIPSSSGGNSKDGGQETFACFDETHLYTLPRLHNMYEKVTNNIIKSASTNEAWFLETTTMYAPGEDSIAEKTYQMVQDAREGKLQDSRILADHQWADLDDIDDPELFVVALAEAYGDATEWMEPYKTMRGVYNSRTAETRNAQRYFLNAISQQHDNSWLTAAQVKRVTLPRTKEIIDTSTGNIFPVTPKRQLIPNEKITMGFDGALSDDATALVGCCVSDGHLFPILVQQKPDGPDGDDWRVDKHAFDIAVAQAFATYDVVGFYADPPYWIQEVEKWEREFGHRLMISPSGKSKVQFWTMWPAQMSRAINRLETAILTGTVTLEDDNTMRRHFLNACVERRRGLDVIAKVTNDSPFKIDVAVASALAFEARGMYLDKGKKKTKLVTRQPQLVSKRRH